MVDLGPGSIVYFNRSDAEVNCPGNGYTFWSSVTKDGRAVYGWSIKTVSPHDLVLDRIEALEQRIAAIEKQTEENR